MQDNKWDDVFGLNPVKLTFDTFIKNNRIPQAVILLGKKGIGKDLIAAKFIQKLNKVSLPEDQLFGSAFLKYIYALPRGQNENSDDDPFEKLKNTELETIKGEIKKKCDNPYYQLNIPRANDIKINSIRDISSYLSYSFTEYKYRMILISNAEKMNDSAQNALLKSLEEPPPGVIFMLTTHDLSGLFPTIVSRCWLIKCPPLQKEEIQNALVSYYEHDSTQAELTAEFGDGSVSTAAEFVMLNIPELKGQVVDFLKYILGNKIHSAFKMISSYTKEQDSSGVLLILNLIKIWFLDILRYKGGETDRLFFNEFIENIHNFNLKFYDEEKLTGIIGQIDKNAYLYRERNVNINIIWFNIITEINSFRK